MLSKNTQIKRTNEGCQSTVLFMLQINHIYFYLHRRKINAISNGSNAMNLLLWHSVTFDVFLSISIKFSVVIATA